MSLTDVKTVSDWLDGFPVAWFICGGWAIDLLLDVESRPHADLEIGVPRSDQDAVRAHFRGRDIYAFMPRQGRDADIVPWTEEHLELPVHQVLVQDPTREPKEFEFFLQEVQNRVWRFRRLPAIQMPYVEVVHRSPCGIPVVAPEIQVLYKSTYHRGKDEQDFGLVLPHLRFAQREWLCEALRMYKPDDEWIPRLR